MINEPNVGSKRQPFSSFEELAVQAKAVLLGTVVNTASGFLDGWPGVMLEVAVLDRRSAQSWYVQPAVFFVFYPGGEVPFGATSICPT